MIVVAVMGAGASARPGAEYHQGTVAGLDPAERAELRRLLEKVAANLSPENATCP